MDKNTALILWTLCWFTFIAILCFIFKNGYILFLLILWLIPFDNEIWEDYYDSKRSTKSTR